MKVLMVAVHPDDIEIMAGGQAIIYSQNGDEVYEILLTRGENGGFEKKYKLLKGDELGKIREQEAKEGAKIMGIKEIFFMDLKDWNVKYNKKIVSAVKELIEKINPDLIYAPEYSYLKTSYFHPDHHNAGKIIKAAVNLLTNKPKLMLYNSIMPNRFTDITPVIKLKKEAIGQHKTQKKIYNKYKLIMWLYFKTWGTISGYKYAEGFREVRFSNNSKESMRTYILKRIPIKIFGRKRLMKILNLTIILLIKLQNF